METSERIGIMGGAFDPVHFGHLQLAKTAFEKLALNKVIFMPSKRSPLKMFSPTAPDKDRLQMLKLALKNAAFKSEICEYEILSKKTPSYSIDTAKFLKKQYPKAKFYWIIGQDQYRQLDRWYKIKELCKIVSFAVFERKGYTSAENTALTGIADIEKVPWHAIQISSTEIREKVKNLQPLNLELPQEVISYIESRKLYK